MADKKKKGKITSDTFKPITTRTAKGKLEEYGLPTDWMNIKNSQTFSDSLQTRYPNQFHLPLKYNDTTGQYLQNFPKWNKGQPALNSQTGKMNEIPEMGLGGLIGGALGSLLPIPGVGTVFGKILGEKGFEAVGKLAGDAIGGLIGGRKEQKQELEQQQQQLQSVLQDYHSEIAQAQNTLKQVETQVRRKDAENKPGRTGPEARAAG